MTFIFKTVEVQFRAKETDKHPNFIAEMRQDGELESCHAYNEFLDTWIDVTDLIEKSDYWMKKIVEKFEHERDSRIEPDYEGEES